MHGTIMVFLGGRAAGRRRVRQLPRAAADRRAGHGVPAAEHARATGSTSPAASSCWPASSLPGGAANSGWTSYPPLADHRDRGPDVVAGRACCLLGVSSLLGAVNFIATIVQLRAPGLTLVPAAVLRLGAVRDRVPAAARVSGAAGRRGAAGDGSRWPAPASSCRAGWSSAASRWTSPAAATRCSGSTCSGSSAHPEVYVLILPAMGIVAEVIAEQHAQAALGLPPDGLLAVRARLPVVRGLGAPHVPHRHGHRRSARSSR